MSIETTLERIATALESIASGKSSSESAPPASPPTAPATGKRGRPPKAGASAEQQAELLPNNPAPAAVSPSSKATTTAPTAAADSSGPTKEDLRVALNGLQKATSVDDVKRLLASFKAQTLSQVPEDKYGAVIARAAALVDAASADAPADEGSGEANPFD